MGEMQVGLSKAIMGRDSFGQFANVIEKAGENLLEDFADKVRDTAKTIVPVRTGTLRDSIQTVRFSHNEYRVVATAPHALPIEKGARPHPITGWVKFYWVKEGRNWVPGENMINHPGNRSQPYLEPAFKLWWPTIKGEMSRRYPG